MSCSPVVLAVVLFLQMCDASAQQKTEEEELALVYGDKSTVSIATGSRQSLRRAPAVATVITAADIAAMGVNELDQVLETVPGMHVGRNNQGYPPLYLIRGIFSEFNPQTLVLQNGVPMTTLFVGNRGNVSAGTPIENIARIEIIRGPGSALYGADAFSGVINVITKSAADIQGTEFGLRAGSFNTYDGWIQHGGKIGAADVAAYLRAGHTDGFKRIVTADAQSFLDQLFGTSASLAPGPVNTGYDTLDGNVEIGHGKLRLRAGFKLRDNVGTGAGAAGALDPIGKGRSQRVIGDVSWSDIELAKNLKLGLAASYFQYVSKFPVPLQLFPPGAFGGSFPNGMLGAPNTWERQLRLSTIATYSGLANHQMRFGAGHDDLNLYRTQELKNFSLFALDPVTGQPVLDPVTGLPVPSPIPVPLPGGGLVESAAADSFLIPQRRRVTYVYAQDEWNFARDWTLTGGVRRDLYSDFGGTTNPRLALVWDIDLALTAKLLYGRAFRAPAFTEEFSINNPVIRGNPNLQPETITTLEAALAWQARPDTQVNLNLFRYRMGDIIRTSDVGGGISMFNNVGSQRGHGLELEGIWDASRSLRLAGHYAYQRSTDEATGQDAGYAPHNHLFARADWTFASGWLFSAQANHVADRRRPAGDPRPQIADYTTLDLTLRTSRSANRWEVSGTVRNLFNADVREPSLAPGIFIPNDLPMAPRAFYLQAIYRL